MGLFRSLNMLKRFPKIRWYARQTSCIIETRQHLPWLGVRPNSSITNKMHIIGSKFKKLFNLQSSVEIETVKVTKDIIVQQQVTPIVTEMIIQQSTLDSMLYVCEKLLPKMTLADKCIVQEVLTNKLYSDIADASPIFIKEQYNKDIHKRLLVDSKLCEAVEPLTSSIVFKRLVDDITADSDYMTDRQVVSLFLNLQLLGWEKECKEVYKLFEKVYALKVQKLSIDEVVMYAHACMIYQPSWYSTHTVFSLLHWCTINEIILENIHWLELLALNTRSRIFSRDAELGKFLFEKIKIKLEEGENIQNLNIYQSLTLLKFFEGKGKIFSPIYNNSVELYEKIANHARQLIEDIGDREIIFLANVWSNHLINSLAIVLSPVLEKKIIQPLLEGKVLKNDVILFACMLASSISHPEVVKKGEDNVKLNETISSCLKLCDAVALEKIGHSVYMNFFREHYDTIMGRIQSFVQKGLFDRDEIPFSLKMFYGSILKAAADVSLHRNGLTVNDVQLRDKFLEDYIKHHVYHEVLESIGCQLCFRSPQMTATSIMFLENIKDIKIDQYRSIRRFGEIKELAKHIRYRRNMCKMNISQSQSALSKFESDMMMKLCSNYQPAGWSNRVWFVGVYKSEPVLKVLSTHALSSRMNEQKKFTEALYSYSDTDPRLILNFFHDTLQKGLITYSKTNFVLRVCSDCFFWGYKPCDEEKISQVLKKSGTLDHIKDTSTLLDKLLNQENIAWNQLIKHYNTIKYQVQLKKSFVHLLQKAFDNHVWTQILTADKLYLEAVVLLDSSYRPVPFSHHKLERAEKLGLKKIAFFQNRYKSLTNSVVKERMMKDLQKAGFKCVLIWDEELQSIANRTLDGKIRLIKTKVRAENSIINTAHQLSYDPIQIQEGPYKKYFTVLNKKIQDVQKTT